MSTFFSFSGGELAAEGLEMGLEEIIGPEIFNLPQAAMNHWVSLKFLLCAPDGEYIPIRHVVFNHFCLAGSPTKKQKENLRDAIFSIPDRPRQLELLKFILKYKKQDRTKDSLAGFFWKARGLDECSVSAGILSDLEKEKVELESLLRKSYQLYGPDEVPLDLKVKGKLEGVFYKAKKGLSLDPSDLIWIRPGGLPPVNLINVELRRSFHMTESSLLATVCQYGNLDQVKFLLERGADLNQEMRLKHSREKMATALIVSIYSVDDRRIPSFLIQHPLLNRDSEGYRRAIMALLGRLSELGYKILAEGQRSKSYAKIIDYRKYLMDLWAIFISQPECLAYLRSGSFSFPPTFAFGSLGEDLLSQLFVIISSDPEIFETAKNFKILGMPFSGEKERVLLSILNLRDLSIKIRLLEYILLGSGCVPNDSLSGFFWKSRGARICDLSRGALKKINEEWLNLKWHADLTPGRLQRIEGESLGAAAGAGSGAGAGAGSGLVFSGRETSGQALPFPFPVAGTVAGKPKWRAKIASIFSRPMDKKLLPARPPRFYQEESGASGGLGVELELGEFFRDPTSEL